MACESGQESRWQAPRTILASSRSQQTEEFPERRSGRTVGQGWVGTIVGLVVSGLAWYATFDMWESSCTSNAQQFISLTNDRVQSHSNAYLKTLPNMGAMSAVSQFAGHVSYASMNTASRATVAASLRATLQVLPNIMQVTARTAEGDVIVVSGRAVVFDGFSLSPSEALLGDPAANTLTKYSFLGTGLLDTASGTAVSAALADWVSSQVTARAWGSVPSATSWSSTLINSTGGMDTTFQQLLSSSASQNSCVLNVELSVGNLTNYFQNTLNKAGGLLTYMVDSSRLLLMSTDSTVANTELVNGAWAQRDPTNIVEPHFEDTSGELLTAQANGIALSKGDLMPRETSYQIEELVSETVYGLGFLVVSALQLEDNSTVLLVLTVCQTAFVLLVAIMTAGNFYRWHQRKKEQELIDQLNQKELTGGLNQLNCQSVEALAEGPPQQLTPYGVFALSRILWIVFTVGVALMYAWLHTNRTATEVYALASTATISQGIVDSIEDLLAVPVQVAERGAKAFKLQEVAAPLSVVGTYDDVVDSSPLDAYLVALTQVFSSTAYMYVGFASTGAMVGATFKSTVTAETRTASSNFTQQAGLFDGVENEIIVGCADSTNGNVYSDYAISSTGTRENGATDSYGAFDSRLRPWYVLGATSSGVNFGQVYQYFGQDILAIPVVTAIKDQSDNLIGVFAVDVPLDFLTADTTKGLVGTHRVVIVEDTGLIVATTHGSTSYITTTGAQNRRSVLASDDDVIRRYAQVIAKDYNAFTQAWGVTLEYKTYTVTVAEVSVPGIDWTMILIVPNSDYVSELEQNNELNVTLLITIVFLAALLLQSYLGEREQRQREQQKEQATAQMIDEGQTSIATDKTITKMQKLCITHFDTATKNELVEIAGNYLMQAEEGVDVYGLIQIETLDKPKWVTLLFTCYTNKSVQQFCDLVRISLLLFEFWEWECGDNSTEKQVWLWFHVLALLVVTIERVATNSFKSLRHSGRKSICLEITATYGLFVLLWVAFVLQEYCVLSNLSGYIKPLICFLKWRSLQITVKMFLRSIANSFSVFLLFAVCVSMTALAMLIVFRSKYTGDSTLDGFLETFIEMFVYMSSGENYGELVGQAREIHSFLVLLYIISGFIGLVVIMSLVQATFQQDYEQQLGAAGTQKSRKRTRSLITSYCLGTFDPDTNTFGSSIKYPDFVGMMVSFNEAKEKAANERLSNQIAAVAPTLSTLAAFGDLVVAPEGESETPGEDGKGRRQLSSPGLCSGADGNVQRPTEEIWRFLFLLLDSDDDQGVDFGEFEYVFYLHETILRVRASDQLSYMVRLSRVEADLKAASRKRSPEALRQQQLLNSLRKHLTHKLAEAQELASEGERAGIFSLRTWDRIAVVVVLCHMFCVVLAFSQKVVSLDTQSFELICSIFPFYYCFEIGNRAWQHGGIWKLLNCPEHPTVAFMHNVDCFVSFFSLGSAIATLVLGSDSPSMLQLMANLCIVRLLVIHPSFRHLLYSCVTGLAPLQMYLVLMLMVYYYFSLAASHLFRDMGTDYKFDTLGESMLTMHQVFLGEGWNQLMADIYASNLNPAIFVFFMVFYLFMGILFTQLFAGIIINLFLRSEEWHSKGGSIYVLLASINPYLASKTLDELEQLVHDLAELDLLMATGMATRAGEALSTKHDTPRVERNDSEYEMQDNSAYLMAQHWKTVAAVSRASSQLASPALDLPHQNPIDPAAGVGKDKPDSRPEMKYKCEGPESTLNPL